MVRPSAAAVVVFAGWAATAAALAWLVGTYATGLPRSDDWTLLPYRLGLEPVTLGWLWEPYAEHRIPLPKLLLVGLYAAAGQDAPAGAAFTAAALIGLALVLPAVAAARRGRAAVTDLFFPLVTLQWGQTETLFHHFQVQFSVMLVPAAAVLAVVVLRGHRMTWRAGVAAGLAIATLPLCGGNGVILAVPLAGWLAAAAWAARRQPGGWVAALSAAAAVGVIGAYFVGYRPTTLPPPPTEEWAVTSLAFFANMFGAAAHPVWVEAAFAGAGLTAVAFGSAAAGAARGRGEWVRAAGLAAFGVGFLGYAVAAGRLRAAAGAGPGDAVLSRYATLALPAWWAVYFLADLYLPGAAFRAALALAALGVYAGNLGAGRTWAEGYAARRADYLRDLDAGFPSVRLAEAYYGPPFGLWDNCPRPLDQGQLMLRAAGVGPFARLAPNPQFREVPAAAAGGWFDPSGTAYTLPAGRRVYGVKFRWAYVGWYVGRPARVGWRVPGRAGPDPGVGAAIDYRPRFLWIDAVVDQVRFGLADEPGGPPVRDLVLFVADDGP